MPPSYLVLARKYRPATFNDVVGQDHVVQTLSNSILSGRVAHAFLFCGVRGVGKTTVARILAKAINCSGRAPDDPNPCCKCSSCVEISNGINVDVHEIDGASNTSVDNIREINENIKYPPVSSPFKIIIIDEVHMISINAFNALLKTLEEPPAHAKFMFATTESHKVPATINSRCQRFNFRTISMKEIVAGLRNIIQQEGMDGEEEAFSMVAREAQGSFRDALSLLDQVMAFHSGFITAEDVTNILGVAGRRYFGILMDSILIRDSANALMTLNDLFGNGYDPEQLVLDMIQYLRNLIVAKTVPKDARAKVIDAPQSELDEMDKLCGKTSVENLQNLFAVLLQSEGDVKRASNPWIAVEMTVLKMANAPDIKQLSEIIKKVETLLPLNSSPQYEQRPRPRQIPPAPVQVSPVKAEPPPTDIETTTDRFTITEVTPLPTTPDEVWTYIRSRVAERGDPRLPFVMDHGRIISISPDEAVIGFHKPIHKDQFQSKFEKPEIRKIFDEVLGNAKVVLMTLVEQTPLQTQKPYNDPTDGEPEINRALKNEAMEHPLTKTILKEFSGSFVEDIVLIKSHSDRH